MPNMAAHIQTATMPVWADGNDRADNVCFSPLIPPFVFPVSATGQWQDHRPPRRRRMARVGWRAREGGGAKGRSGCAMAQQLCDDS